MGALHDGRLLWFVNRGAGVVLLALLTASVALGVLSTLRLSSPSWPRFVTQAVHRNISLLAIVAVVVHAGSAVLDSYVDLRWRDLVIPFIAGYRGFWVGLGALAFDLLLLISLTSLVRHRLTLRGWRIVHLGSYPAWALGVTHGLGIGTDRTAAWSVLVTAACLGTVAGAVVIRVSAWTRERSLAAG